MRINIHPKYLSKKTEQLVRANAPTILTLVGAAGVGVTAYVTGKATVKATELIREELDHKAMKAMASPETVNQLVTIEKKEKMLLVWKLYIPAVGVGLVSIASILMANRINTKRLTAAVAAYTMAERAHEEYKDKVVELTSKGKEQKVRDEVAKDHVLNTPQGSVYVTGRGGTLCFDATTGRYFLGDIEKIKKAQNDLNYRMLAELSCSLSDFYDCLGLPHTAISDDVGWNVDNNLELELTSVLVGEDDADKAVIGAPIGEPVLSVDFRRSPFPGFR